MTAETEREKVIIVIKKLLNMAEHASSNEHEALAAAKQAEALMRKYNVQYADAIAAEIKTGASIVTKDCIATAKDNGTATKQTPPWAQQLGVRVAELFDAPVRLTFVKTNKGYESAIRFHGYEHDVEVAAWTFDVLVATINRICKVYRTHPNYLRNGRASMNAFRIGVVTSICTNLHQMALDKEQAEAQEETKRLAAAGALSSGTSLVWIKRDAVEKKFGKFEYRTKKRGASVKDAQAYHDGRTEGRKVEIQGAIKDGRSTKQLGA